MQRSHLNANLGKYIYISIKENAEKWKLPLLFFVELLKTGQK